VRIALDGGHGLSEHEARVPVLIQVLSGRVEVEADGRLLRLSAGAVLYLGARVRHTLRAEERSHLMLTLLKGPRDSREPGPTAGSAPGGDGH
jgi:quercetin dioxygenase-like cupin family protein